MKLKSILEFIIIYNALKYLRFRSLTKRAKALPLDDTFGRRSFLAARTSLRLKSFKDAQTTTSG
jgi:hypothetical protein